MAWTTPGTATAGDVLTAAYWNVNVRDNMNALNSVVTNVQSTTVTAITASTTSASLADITGLTTTITPSSATSRVLVLVQMNIGYNLAQEAYFNLVRNSTAIGIGVGGAANYTSVIRLDAYTTSTIIPFSINFVDSPATTSATTYKMQWAVNTGTMWLNRRSDTNFAVSSSITAMEIKV